MRLLSIVELHLLLQNPHQAGLGTQPNESESAEMNKSGKKPAAKKGAGAMARAALAARAEQLRREQEAEEAEERRLEAIRVEKEEKVRKCCL